MCPHTTTYASSLLKALTPALEAAVTDANALGYYKSTITDAAAGTNAQILTQPALPGLLFIAKDAVGIISGDASVLNVFFF